MVYASWYHWNCGRTQRKAATINQLACPSYSLYVQLLWYPMYYPGGMKARVGPVQWSKPNSILAPLRIRTRVAGFRVISGDHYTTTAHKGGIFFPSPCLEGLDCGSLVIVSEWDFWYWGSSLGWFLIGPGQPVEDGVWTDKRSTSESRQQRTSLDW